MALEEEQEATLKIIALRPQNRALPGWRSFLIEWRRAALAVLPTFLTTRLALVLLTYFAGVIFNTTSNISFPLTFNTVVYSWYHWEATRYLTIATQGYLSKGYLAYFPLYPATVHTLSMILHQDPLIIGMLVSNLAFFAALMLLYRFVAKEFDQETAQRCVLYLTIFPTAALYFAAYAESLFLLFVLASFYTLRQRMWWLAGLFGGLATLTDAAGILLLIVLLCELVFASQQKLFSRKRQTIPQWLVPLGATLLIPLSLAIYAYALQKQLANPLAFLRFEDGTSRWRFPWTAPLTALHNLVSPSPYTFAAVHSFFELSILSLLLFLLIYIAISQESLLRGYLNLIIFMALMIIYSVMLPTMPGAMPNPYDPLPAIQTTSLTTFVAFIPLALLGRRHPWFHQGYILLSLPLFTFIAIQLISNHWSF